MRRQKPLKRHSNKRNLMLSSLSMMDIGQRMKCLNGQEKKKENVIQIDKIVKRRKEKN
jgi:sRNA-binding protein